MLQIFPRACNFIESRRTEGLVFASSFILRRTSVITPDVLACIAFLSSTASQISVFDLSFVIGSQLLSQCGHASFDGQIIESISFFEAIKLFELGRVFFFGEFSEIKSALAQGYLY